MFRFTAQGRVGRIQELKSNTLRVTVAADRIVEGREETFTKTEWLGCVSFDAKLNQTMLTELDKGDSVSIEGRVVPRTWMKGEQKVYDTTLEITGFKRLSRPKAKSNGKAKSEETAEAAA